MFTMFDVAKEMFKCVITYSVYLLALVAFGYGASIIIFEDGPKAFNMLFDILSGLF